MVEHRSKRLALVLAVVVSGTQIPRLEAAERTDAPGSCAGVVRSHLNYRFVDGTANWTAAAQQAFRDSVARWARLRRENGLAYFTASEVTSSENVRVVRGQVGGGNSNVNCSPAIDELNMHSAEPGSNPGFFTTAAHESGHGYGLDHTGNQDTLTYNNAQIVRAPLMTGCGTAASAFPEADDQMAVVMHATTGVAHLPVGPLNPDRGFESAHSNTGGDLLPWSGIATTITNTPFEGGRYAQIAAGPLAQRLRVATPPNNFRFRFAYKTTGTSGANPKFSTRTVSYPGGAPPCGSTWQRALNYNSPSVSGYTLRSNLYYASNSAWQQVAYQTITNGGGSFAGLQAVDVKLEIFNADSAGGTIFFDNVQIDSL